MSKNQDLGELINGIRSLGTNQLNAPAYTSASSFTGTLAGLLGFDSSGNVISLASTSLTLSAGQISAAIGYNPVPDNRTLTINGVTYDLTANRSWSVSGSSQWTTSGSNIYFTGGFVGINQTSPLYALDVSGGARFTAWSSMGINARFAWNMISDQYLADGYAGAIRIDNADGRFSFYTTPTGVAGAFPVQTERFTITNVGNVGIGTSSPNGKLNISNGGGEGIEFWVVSNTATNLIQSYNRSTSAWNSLEYKALDHIFYGSGTERMRISSAGNVGIGTSTPGASLEVRAGSGANLRVRANGTNTLLIQNYNDTDNYRKIQFAGSNIIFNSATEGSTDSAEFMRIFKVSGYSSTTLSMRTTSPYRPSAAINIYGDFGITFQSPYTLGATHCEFVTLGGSIVGNIVTNATNTFYTTSSDYRLKYNYQEIKALELINNLKIYQFKWKVDNSLSYGVQAHELQEHLPYAVTGQKDGEAMQSVDYSKLAPIAIAGVKQLHKLFESHTEKIARLESEVEFLKSNIA
jgi:hypothetical protein